MGGPLLCSKTAVEGASWPNSSCPFGPRKAAAAAEAVRNLRSPKSDEEEEEEDGGGGENGRHSEQRCGDDDDDDRKGLKDEIDDGENKEKQVSQSVSLHIFLPRTLPSLTL